MTNVGQLPAGKHHDGYVLVLGFSIGFNYVAGLLLGRLNRPLASKAVLALAVAGNLGLLVA